MKKGKHHHQNWSRRKKNLGSNRKERKSYGRGVEVNITVNESTCGWFGPGKRVPGAWNVTPGPTQIN